MQPNEMEDFANSVDLDQTAPICPKTYVSFKNNQSRTNGPINAHLTITQVMPKYNHNNEKQEALL